MIFNELDIGNLALRQRRNDEEERNYEKGDHDRKMEDVRTTGRFRHLDDEVRIYTATSGCGVIVSVTNGISDESNEETKQDERDGAAEISFFQHLHQHAVGLHVEALPER